MTYQFFVAGCAGGVEKQHGLGMVVAHKPLRRLTKIEKSNQC